MSSAETATVMVKTPLISKTLAMPPATAVSCAAVIDTVAGGKAPLEAVTRAVLTGAFDKRFVISVGVCATVTVRLVICASLVMLELRAAS